MSNKTDLQANNTDLQEILQAVQDLPTAVPWGGATNIVATEIEQDLVIPAYTDTELTVKKVEKGMQADFGTINLVENSNGKVQTITIYHSLGTVPESFYLFPNGDIDPPRYGDWGGVSIHNNKMYGVSTYESYGGEITIYPTSINLQKTATYIKIKITDGEYAEYSFYTGNFAWIVM